MRYVEGQIVKQSFCKFFSFSSQKKKRGQQKRVVFFSNPKW
jgi:hypothetical protein